MQRLAAAQTDLAHHDEQHHREHDTDRDEYRAERHGGNSGDERHHAETADDSGQYAQHECQYRQRPGAAVEDIDPAAVVGDDQPARVDEYTGLGRCIHALQGAIPRAASVRKLAKIARRVCGKHAHSREVAR